MSEYTYDVRTEAILKHAERVRAEAVADVTEKVFINSCERMRILGGKKKAIVQFYKADCERTNTAHKEQTGRRAALLTPVQEAIDKYATHCGQVATLLDANGEAPKVEGIKHTRVYPFEIQDESVVPKKFWSVDEAKLKEHIKEHKGIVDIPGVTVAIETKLALTGK